MKLTVGTRGSQLALWQAEHVRDRLLRAHPHLEIDFRIVRTTGDRITDVPLSSIGDRGLFTRELDRALLDREADLAVHSLKDVPTVLPAGLLLAAVLEREDPRDAFLVAPGRPETVVDLPAGATVGTSSLRRRALLLDVRPDLTVVDLRGNLDTRLERLRSGACDAAILALAGLKRLGRTELVGEILSPPEWLPAAGQGAVAVVCRADDHDARNALRALDHVATRTAVLAERAFLRALEGGCQIPLGALAQLDDATLTLRGFVAGVRSGTVLRGERTGSSAEPAAAGLALATDLRARGADALLLEVRSTYDATLPSVSPP